MTEDRPAGVPQPAFALWSAATLLSGAMLLPSAREPTATAVAVAAGACVAGLVLALWGARRAQPAAALALLASAGA
ncbi:MAG: hypothetical protein HOV79_26670, partial [Hamadaea sp.]|nr:hypothetical protein [Hamadaea sp.]